MPEPLRLAPLALLAGLLLACCPVPAGTPQDTSFAAVVSAVSTSAASVTLGSREVSLVFARPHEAELAVGQKVYVEGMLLGNIVDVSRIVVIQAADPG